ncbi:MAG: tRNA (adenosine(37)-N6)-dimethylallyltransferase MiaA [Bauldia sp.]|nr:tRNA (adenosine(37)-N6)-dimethylallyltransferase MiaA [Bauldia sp.]
MPDADAILIAGPTASGKSERAMALARTHDGMVINADSMQVYAELRVLSARPGVDEEAAVPHRLYGHVSAATRYSVGRWLTDVTAVLAEARARRHVPIFVGGTGLYFKALTEGLVSIPPIPPEVRARVLAEAEAVAAPSLHARLATLDPETAAGLRPSDRARILRALEVHAATGRPLAEWQRGAGAPPLVDAGRASRIVLDPPRAWLHQRIAARADRMVHDGAIGEARALAALGLSAEMPAMKAIGVRQFLDHDLGKLTLDEALAAVKTETRRYAKRQATWFRHQMADWPRQDPSEDGPPRNP